MRATVSLERALSKLGLASRADQLAGSLTLEEEIGEYQESKT